MNAAASGVGEFYACDGHGGISVLQNHTGWRKSWTQVLPGNFRGTRFGRPSDLLFYDADAGLGEFYTCDGQGGISVLKKHTAWRKSWTHIVPGNFRGAGSADTTDLLFYDADDRLGDFYACDGQGGISVLKKHTGWRKSWTHIVPGNFGGSRITDLLFYDADAGLGEFYTCDGQGGVSVLKKHTGWRKSWTHIVRGNFGGSGFTDLLFYDADAGFGQFYTCDGQGGISVLKDHTGWRENWTHIVPGNFSDDSGGGSTFTDLLFYAR